jgi:ADP-ribose pyrophosphatase YjhB (NUDIX family)
MIKSDLLEEVKKLKAISDIGLLYCNNQYDKERYLELQGLSFSILKKVSGHDKQSLQVSFPSTKDYPTAKVDIRGLVLSKDRKVLMVKESADGKWSLPGGWADIGYSPREVIVKEFKEETGLDVIPQKLIAVFDKRMYAHPPQPFYVYKMVFYCEAISSGINKGFDVLDVQYFDVYDLPELSEDRILKSQIMMLLGKVLSNDFETYFD